ncbi:MAG TPA: protein kinase, partial [Acidobacteriota bacterium]|nr:protein kinase [Acidobacteriota bacterium]
TPERWKQIDDLLQAALDLEPEKRSVFLRTACGEDHELRQEVETLLESDDEAQSFIESPALEIAQENSFAFSALQSAQTNITKRLAEGDPIGPYRILSLIGAGGMGEVYRASDPRIGREVAIKILPAQFSQDSDRMKRFELEARAAGMINHPNILAIYDTGKENGCPYLVSEFLQGEVLRQKIRKTSLTIQKSLDYSLQIIKGLSAAHSKGIVHRDLKPENIFITKQGHAKILDFGLAKLTHPEFTNSSNLEEKIQHQTETGVVVGTVVYMSPEQVRGMKVDHRSDIFAFGAILFEMLSGERPFRGDSQIEIMHAILKTDPPPLSDNNAKVPPGLERVVRRCLEKDPDHRFQTTSDLAFALETFSTTSDRAIPLPQEKKRFKLSWLLAALSLLAAFLLGAAIFQRIWKTPAESPPVRRLSIQVPTNHIIQSMAISPDGKYLAYAPIDEHGGSMLHVRSLDLTEPQEIPGTHSASLPFWSPDSRSIGFFAENLLKIVNLGGGSPRSLCDVDTPKGGTWNRDGVIVFARTNWDGLYRISASGGEPVKVTELDVANGEWTHRFPQFLPDGHHFFYMVNSGQEEQKGLFIGSLDSKIKKRLLPDYQKVEYADPGYGFFVRNNKMIALSFDMEALKFTGEAISIAEEVNAQVDPYTSLFSVSENDVITYSGNGGGWASQPVWFDRSGKQIGRFQNGLDTYGQPDSYQFYDLSPDEKLLLTNAAHGVAMVDLLSGRISRYAVTDDSSTLFSPDGKNVVYFERTDNAVNICQRLSSGASKAEILFRSNKKLAINEQSWSRDGRFILFRIYDRKTKYDIWVLPLFGERKLYPYLKTAAREGFAQFSPDGKFVAYVSDESGTPEVYVRTFPVEAGGKWQVSIEGGQQPRWRRDGKELFYLDLEKNLVAAEVQTEKGFNVGKTQKLFKAEVESSNLLPNFNYKLYFPADNGQRFLMNKLISNTEPVQITVMLNWKSLLKKK